MKPQATKRTWHPHKARRLMATKRTQKRDVVGLVFTAALVLSGLAMLVMVASEARGADIHAKEYGYVAYKEDIHGAENRIGLAMEDRGMDYCLPTEHQYQAFKHTQRVAVRVDTRECLRIEEPEVE